MKAHTVAIFESACPLYQEPLYQEGALSPIFEGDAHQKKGPQNLSR
jgi:hypothetical protein